LAKKKPSQKNLKMREKDPKPQKQDIARFGRGRKIVNLRRFKKRSTGKNGESPKKGKEISKMSEGYLLKRTRFPHGKEKEKGGLRRKKKERSRTGRRGKKEGRTVVSKVPSMSRGGGEGSPVGRKAQDERKKGETQEDSPTKAKEKDSSKGERIFFICKNPKTLEGKRPPSGREKERGLKRRRELAQWHGRRNCFRGRTTCKSMGKDGWA